MIIKSSVTSTSVQPPIYYALGIAEMVYRYNGLKLVVTSLTDGQHMPDSLHYKGLAADIRTRDIPDVLLRSVHGSLSSVLSPMGFDVILEKDHIHLEFDPKEGKTWQRSDTQIA